ncbi:MAG: hypothetical protein ACHQ0J_07925 [Candidatus Dormibacterales bacterium]
MLALSGVVYIGQHHTAGSASDWFATAGLLVVIALAFGAMYLMSGRVDKRQRINKLETSDSHRKAA